MVRPATIAVVALGCSTQADLIRWAVEPAIEAEYPTGDDGDPEDVVWGPTDHDLGAAETAAKANACSTILQREIPAIRWETSRLALGPGRRFDSTALREALGLTSPGRVWNIRGERSETGLYRVRAGCRIERAALARALDQLDQCLWDAGPGGLVCELAHLAAPAVFPDPKEHHRARDARKQHEARREAVRDFAITALGPTLMSLEEIEQAATRSGLACSALRAFVNMEDFSHQARLRNRTAAILMACIFEGRAVPKAARPSVAKRNRDLAGQVRKRLDCTDREDLAACGSASDS